jgi:predicted nucleotidyltransferase component of viral defense system
VFLETISEEMTLVINKLSDIPALYENFYMAGGTGLSLQLGHRKSNDLDFFSENKFDSEKITLSLTGTGAKITSAEENTVYAVINGVKISLIFYPYPLIKDLIPFNGIRISGIEDIACMKTIAISQRAEKKDFFDMFEILKILNPLLIKELVLKKYGEKRINCYHILKSFFYFNDAEESLDPVSLNHTSWKTVKNYFIKNEKPLRDALLCS